VVFRRVDLAQPVDIKADPYFVGDTRLSSCLERDGVRPVIADALMPDGAAEVRLARVVLDAVGVAA
jgi:hypothetical protein